MKINESSSLNSLNSSVDAPATRPARAQPSAEAAPSSELGLTAATQAAFSGRPERIAELRSLVSSGTYATESQKVSQKIVDDALSRPE